jgi:hypothetical protein
MRLRYKAFILPISGQGIVWHTVRAEFGITEPARGFDECIGPALDSTEKVRR